MLRNFLAAIVVCSFALGTSISIAQEMTRELVDKLKSSAVYIFTKVGQSGGTGSGWIIEKDATGVLIVTNRHVVTDDEGRLGDEVKCYFHPGTEKEQAYIAKIIVVDPDEDLAVLRVEQPGLPDPMPLIPDVNSLFETQKVYTVGFPKGEALRFGERAPGVTIAETTVSGMRRFDDNSLAAITINGGVTNGNSGGMTVNSKGEVVGVVVAMLSSANNIAFVIPVSQVTSLFRGKPSQVIGIPAVSADPTKVVIDFYVNCFDPKGGVTELEFFHGPATVIQGISPDKLVMTRSIIPGMSTAVGMKYDRSRAQGSCRVTFEAAQVTNQDVVIQVTTKRSDGMRVVTSPVAVRLDTKKQMAFSPGYKNASEVVRSSSGVKGVTSDTKPIKMDSPVTDMVVAGSGRYLLIRSRGDIAVVDLASRERVKTINVADESLVAGGADFFVIYNSFTHKFEKWSLATMEKVLESPPPKDLKPIAMALGHSSNGPLFVYDIPKMMVPSGNARLSCAFLSLEDFKGRPEIFYEGPLPRAQGAGDGFGALTQAEIRAAGNGSCFTMWRPYTLPQGMAVFRNKRVKGKLAIDNEDDSGLYVVPSTDGETICTLLGAKSNDLKREKMSGIFLPCTDTQHILSLSAKGFELKNTANGSTVQTFDVSMPELAKINNEKAAIEFFFGLDKRMICSPQYDVMALSVPGSDTVALSKLGLKIVPSASPSGGAPPVQIANATMRAWTNPAGRQIRAKLLSVSADGVELQLEKGGTAKVSFDKLSDADVKYAKFEGDKARGALGGK